MTVLIRYTVAALTLLCLISTTHAGTGIKVGATVSQWNYVKKDSILPNIANGTNFAIVGIQEFALSKTFSIQIEPTYSVRSFDMSIDKLVMQQLGQYTQPLPDTLPSSLSYTQKFASLDCPVLLKVNLTESGIRPYIFAGPNVSVNLSATATANFDTTNMQLQKPLDVTPEAKGAVINVDMGAGVQIPLALSIALVADARYTFGLGDVSSFKAFGTAIGTAKTGDIRVFAGIVLDL
ncbi:MAG: porin family protein [Candidatus Kapaibacterium sp.]